MLPKEIFNLSDGKEIINELETERSPTVTNWHRQRFVTRSQNCMNRAIEEIRRIGRLGDRFIFADHEAERMIDVLREELELAEYELRNRQQTLTKKLDEFTWES